MLRLLGTILVIGACGALGFSARQRLARRASVLNQIIQALDVMAAELSERQTPLPDIIAQLQEEGGEESRRFFPRFIDGFIRKTDYHFHIAGRRPPGIWLRNWDWKRTKRQFCVTLLFIWGGIRQNSNCLACSRPAHGWKAFVYRPVMNLRQKEVFIVHAALRLELLQC